MGHCAWHCANTEQKDNLYLKSLLRETINKKTQHFNVNLRISRKLWAVVKIAENLKSWDVEFLCPSISLIFLASGRLNM